MDRYIAIVDYGAGNLFSMKNALDYIGARSIITSEPEALERSAAVLLPGVGAFPDAMNKLRAAALTGALCASARRKPFLGIVWACRFCSNSARSFLKRRGSACFPAGGPAAGGGFARSAHGLEQPAHPRRNTAARRRRRGQLRLFCTFIPGRYGQRVRACGHGIRRDGSSRSRPRPGIRLPVPP